jgi:hypothetical protein
VTLDISSLESAIDRLGVEPFLAQAKGLRDQLQRRGREWRGAVEEP